MALILCKSCSTFLSLLIASQYRSRFVIIILLYLEAFPKMVEIPTNMFFKSHCWNLAFPCRAPHFPRSRSECRMFRPRDQKRYQKRKKKIALVLSKERLVFDPFSFGSPPPLRPLAFPCRVPQRYLSPAANSLSSRIAGCQPRYLSQGT